ncbi:MAG: VCBS repeat-containing protein, partial [Kofleriaceae bacterium]
MTRIEDAFSNQIDFAYEQGIVGECRIKSITWGQNPTVGQGPFARVLFTYAAVTDPCGTGIAIGSQTSYRTGTQIITGASQLDKIESLALLPSAPGGPQNWRHKRTVTLGYASATASCSAAHAPYRALASIQESAVGTDSPQVDLPAITFGYGDASVNYGAITQPAIPWSITGAGWRNYNLGWGYRPPGDAWPTVEAMMLDLDGDGLVDRIVSEPAVDGTGRTLCRAHWYRNRGGASTFADGGVIDMPTVKWATDNDPAPTTPWDGGLYPGANPSTGGGERCALNYQRSAYRNSNSNFLGLCPDSAGTFNCPQQLATNKGWCDLAGRGTKSDCGIKTANQGDTHFAWRWMDMDGDQLPDLVGSPVTGGVVSYDLQRGNLPGAPQEPSIFGPFPACPQTPYTADPSNWSVDAYTMCGGMFPWFVYKNHGNGVFGEARTGITGMTHDTWGPLPTKILYQPIALESTNGDSSVTSHPVGQYQGTLDIDGDGFQDAVRYDATRWKVFRNDGTGQFVPAVADSPFLFRTQISSFLSRTDYPPYQVPAPVAVEGLDDFNGDGLVDHWVGNGSMVNARFNNGVAFLTTGTSIDRPGPDGQPSVQPFDTTGPPTYYVCRGNRVDDRRTIDLDGDGRADLLTNNNGNLGVRYNAGGRFTLSSSTSLGQGGGFRRFQVDSDDPQACTGTTKWWATTEDYIDLDGDGVKEDVELSSAGQMYRRSVTQVAPRRLLVSINNQRGMTTTIAYSSMNGPAVTQAPNLNKSMPNTGWVAQSVTTADVFSNTNATTEYAYRYPHASSDPDAGFPTSAAFRGFEEVTTTHPGPTGLADGSGKRTVNRYDYQLDWSGRLVATLVLPGTSDVPTPGANEVRTIEKASWQVATLFGGDLRTFHPYVKEQFTCANGQTEATCTAAAAPGYARTTSTIAAKDGMAIVETSSLLQAGTANADGDRESLVTYQLDATAQTYFLHPFETTRSYRVASAMVMFDKQRETWNPTNGRQVTDEKWIDGAEYNRLITTNQYTPEGNLWKVTDPRGYTFENEYDSL